MMNRLCVLHGFTPKPRSCRRQRDELRGHHLEAQAEAPLHLALPLEAHRRRADDEDEARLLSQEQLLEHEPRLDGLAEPDVVRDEEVRARELERLHERRELVRHELDARAERRLEGVASAALTALHLSACR